MSAKELNVFIVSDATGATADSVFTAARVQFPHAHFNVQRFPFTRTDEDVDDVLDRMPKGKCVVVYSLLSPKHRKRFLIKGRRRGLTLVDLVGPMISVFSKVLRKTPKLKPGALEHRDDAMAPLTDAIRYTMAHDDGLGHETLSDADILILGVSRTGKTPTSIYLSCRKLKVANIPIVQGIPFPKGIARLPIKKVGFRIRPERLLQLRASRAGNMSHRGVRGYASMTDITRELDYSEEIFDQIPGIKTVDVTDRSIEETAYWIARHVF